MRRSAPRPSSDLPRPLVCADQRCGNLLSESLRQARRRCSTSMRSATGFGARRQSWPADGVSAAQSALGLASASVLASASALATGVGVAASTGAVAAARASEVDGGSLDCVGRRRRALQLDGTDRQRDEQHKSQRRQARVEASTIAESRDREWPEDGLRVVTDAPWRVQRAPARGDVASSARCRAGERRSRGPFPPRPARSRHTRARARRAAAGRRATRSG